MVRSLLALVLAIAGVALGASTVQWPLRAELVVSGLSSPVAFVQDPSDPTVQVLVEKGGRVRTLKDGVLQESDFLAIDVDSDGEKGLLGLAFAPDYASSGRLYINFIDLSGRTVIARFLRSGDDPLRADPASRFDLVWPDGQPFIDKPSANHHGGQLAFGPDGYLYVGLGDGGSGDDPDHLAQDPRSLLGKFLRIDVSVGDDDPEGYDVPADNPFVGHEGVLGEIWSFGWRNPWRWSFDDPARGGSGGLVSADVGQGGWEEINTEPAGAGGRNYGWRNREGAQDYLTDLEPFSPSLTDPIFQYSHVEGRSITGGVVYRGSALGSAYIGRYFFGDFVRSRIWSLAVDAGADPGSVGDLQEHTDGLDDGAQFPSSFGVDAGGEIYVVNYRSGTVHRIVLDTATAPTPAPSVPGTPAPPGTCTSPDPFAILGGGTCAGGNWYPRA